MIPPQRLLCLFALLSTAAFAGPAVELEPSRAAVVLMRVLAYDRNLALHPEVPIVIGVVYQPGDRASEVFQRDVTEALNEAAHRFKVQGHLVRALSLPFRDEATLEARLASDAVAVLYVSPGLAPSIGAITTASRRRQVLTFGCRRPYIQLGVSIGLVLEEEGRVKLLLNLPATKAEGAMMEAGLLRIAQLM